MTNKLTKHELLKRYNLNNGGSDYKLENVTNKHCPKCNELLFNEIHKDIDYPYVCLLCDENFYNIELKEENGKSQVDLFMKNPMEHLASQWFKERIIK